ncbi:MAG TPA: transporter [Lysobacter sp.]
MASFMDSVSAKPALLLRWNLVNYEGGVTANRSLPIGGLAAANADVSLWANGATVFWRPSFEISDSGKWSYSMSATIPYVSLDVAADVATTLPGGGAGPARRISDSQTGVGDVVLMPLMFNYNVSPDLNVNMRMTFYAPTGSYRAGRLANTGKNYWSYEPTVALMYFGAKNGFEASWFTGLTINETNDATDYKSGNQFHTELTLAQHFPFAKGMTGAGLTGYYYDQVTGDSGSGATFGDFESRVAGAGPVMSYVRTIGKNQLLSELKWIHEFSAEKRPEGDTVFLKVMYKFNP